MVLISVFWTKDVLVALLVLLAVPLLYNLWLAFLSVWWRPLSLKWAFESQGIACLPFRSFRGNLPEIAAMNKEARHLPMPDVSHDIAPRIFPHFFQWAKKYGDRYVYWVGSEARLNLTDVEDIREIFSTKFGFYPKPERRPDVSLLGNGLIFLEGKKWAQHRRIMNPAFFLEKLKAMIPTMVACTTALTDKWSTRIEERQAIDVQKEFKDVTADIIAHTAFGSSFGEGKQVFALQTQQGILADKIMRSAYIPGARFLPTAFNRLCWRIDRKVKRVLRQVINNRLYSIAVGGGYPYGNDLLGLMMAANKEELEGHPKKLTMSINEVIDECKTFFFAGHETTATLLTWTILLLAINPAWQERTREEVQAICGMKETPTADSLNHLKVMGMVLNEVLRLYPPVVTLVRKAATDMELGNIRIPKGAMLTLPIIALHHEKRYWGCDANEFRPERFSKGIVKASRVAGAFIPFGMGPRICIGQTFALLEARAMLSTILQRYRFQLSPAYRHAPTTLLTLQPQFGMPILFEKL